VTPSLWWKTACCESKKSVVASEKGVVASVLVTEPRIVIWLKDPCTVFIGKPPRHSNRNK
jgi:hypothetical protein